jgi:hypothetical protein
LCLVLLLLLVATEELVEELELGRGGGCKQQHDRKQRLHDLDNSQEWMLNGKCLLKVVLSLRTQSG